VAASRKSPLPSIEDPRLTQTRGARGASGGPITAWRLWASPGNVRVRVPADPEATAVKPEKTVAADVYADDHTNPNSSLDTGTTLFLFRIEADAEPGVFARVAAVFNIANIAPRRATLDRESPGTVNIRVFIELARAGIAEMLRRKLEQLTCTLSVEVVTGESD